jgi:hypothetical protein
MTTGLPLLGAAVRAAAKKVAEKGGKQETKKPLPNSSAERKEREKEAMVLAGSMAATIPAGYGVKAMRDSREQEAREAASEMKRETRGVRK